MEKKKYFIGWMPVDTQRELIECIACDIAQKFSIQNVSKAHPFHITAKVPFWATDLEIIALSEKLKSFTCGLSLFSLKMDGYGHFGNTVIYADIVPDLSLMNFLLIQKRLYENLFLFESWMKFDRFEPLVLPHITVAKDDVDIKCAAVLEYLRAQHRMDFTFDIDSLYLFEKKDDVWGVHKKFKFH
jgi:2'-5' RNA ligase